MGSFSWAQPALPGGFHLQEPDRPDTVEMAKKVVALFKQEHPEYNLVKIHKAATQVVAGLNYYFLLEFSQGSQKFLWEIIAYVDMQQKMTLVKKKQITKAAPKPLNLLGGFKPQDPQAPIIKEKAQQAFALLQKEHPQLVLVKVCEASTQVVAGMNYRFIFELQHQNQNVFWEVVLYEDLQRQQKITKKQPYQKPVPQFTACDLKKIEYKKVMEHALVILQKKHPQYQLSKVDSLAMKQDEKGTTYRLCLQYLHDNEVVNMEVLLFEALPGQLKLISEK